MGVCDTYSCLSDRAEQEYVSHVVIRVSHVGGLPCEF